MSAADPDFWLRGAAEVIGGLGQQPDPSADIARIETVFGQTFPVDPQSPDTRSVRAVLPNATWVRVSYTAPPDSGFGLFFSTADGSSPSAGMNAANWCQSLETSGFSLERSFGQHGQWIGFLLTRGTVSCEVDTVGTPNADESIARVRVSWLLD